MNVLVILTILVPATVAQSGWGPWCGLGLWRCFGSGTCKYTDYVCDGENDCGDWSDEPITCPNHCGWFKFLCANGNCINTLYICDGDDDCGDNSDEIDVNTGKCPTCPEWHHTCPDTGRCVSNEYVCNSIDHCPDGSDEPANCTSVLCTERQRFRCDNGDCLSLNTVCDGYIDCPDASDEKTDEQGVCIASCPDGFFKCTNGRCKPHHYLCERRNDCGDWSDESEEVCSCKEDEYRCKKPDDSVLAGRCIPKSLVCDEEGIWDCILGDDEANCTNTNME